jgi:hypothetical protein
MYAEAMNEVEGPNGPNSYKMFDYLERIRQRAGLPEPDVRKAWEQYALIPNKPTRSKEDLREIIRRERTIELAFEGKRFWDLRRWKKITDMNEQPRGWDIEGENMEDFYHVINVYEKVVTFSTKNYFFPIPESNIWSNDYLIQNYGW